MEDVSQPAPEPYSLGDQVRIYLDPTDPDAHTHGTVCEITDVLEDDLLRHLLQDESSAFVQF